VRSKSSEVNHAASAQPLDALGAIAQEEQHEGHSRVEREALEPARVSEQGTPTGLRCVGAELHYC